MEFDLSRAWVRAMLGAIAGMVCLQLGMSIAGWVWAGRIALAPSEMGYQWYPLTLGAVIGAVVWGMRIRALISGLIMAVAWTLPLVVHLWRYMVTENPWVYVSLHSSHFVGAGLAGMLLGKLICMWYVPEETRRGPSVKKAARRLV